MGTRGAILVSNKQARLKPCLRCGYSLLHIAGARNCPECGLAVRVSLSGNLGLEWSNPRWQRFVALGFSVLACGMVCRGLSFAVGWVVYWAYEEDYQWGDGILRFLERIDSYSGEADLLVCGLALCILAKGERRYPDRSRALRAINLGAGMLLFVLGLLNVLMRHALWWLLPSRSRYLIWHVLNVPWIPLVITVSVCAYALHLGKRSGSRLLRRLSQVPVWPTAAGLVVWLLKIDQLFSPLPSLILDAAFPLAMIVTIVAAIRVLVSGAREADQNWVTDR